MPGLAGQRAHFGYFLNTVNGIDLILLFTPSKP